MPGGEAPCLRAKTKETGRPSWSIVKTGPRRAARGTAGPCVAVPSAVWGGTDAAQAHVRWSTLCARCRICRTCGVRRSDRPLSINQQPTVLHACCAGAAAASTARRAAVGAWRRPVPLGIASAWNGERVPASGASTGAEHAPSVAVPALEDDGRCRGGRSRRPFGSERRRTWHGSPRGRERGRSPTGLRCRMWTISAVHVVLRAIASAGDGPARHHTGRCNWLPTSTQACSCTDWSTMLPSECASVAMAGICTTVLVHGSTVGSRMAMPDRIALDNWIGRSMARAGTWLDPG